MPTTLFIASGCFLSRCNTRSSRHLLLPIVTDTLAPMYTFRLFHITKRWWRMIVSPACFAYLFIFVFISLDFYIYFFFVVVYFNDVMALSNVNWRGAKHVRTKERWYTPLYYYIFWCNQQLDMKDWMHSLLALVKWAQVFFPPILFFRSNN